LPTPGDGGISASSCPIGKGSVDAPCQKLSPRLLDQLQAAIDRLVRDHPEIFNRADEDGAHSGQYLVLKSDEYLDGVISNLRAAGLCAERTMDRERIVAKITNDFSEEWDVITSRGYIRRGRGSYIQTCTPASFPIDPQDVIHYVRTVFFGFECLTCGRAPTSSAWTLTGASGTRSTRSCGLPGSWAPSSSAPPSSARKVA
jgi:hypothetical protein